MKLIVGLGNPGKEYEKTRHNAGFWALDQVAKMQNVKFKQDKRFGCEIAHTSIGDEKVLLVKPQTFMNRSGEAVKKILEFYKIDTSDTLIFCDDTYLSLGSARARFDGQSGGHNGLDSVINSIGPNFWRARIGIGEQGTLKLEDYVLQKMPDDELKTVLRSIDIVTSDMVDLITQKNIENKTYQIN